MAYIYILKSKKDGKHYIGQTNNIEYRLLKHNSGKVRSTRNRRPLELIYFKKFNSKSAAMKREKQLKLFKNKNYINWLIKNNGLVV